MANNNQQANKKAAQARKKRKDSKITIAVFAVLCVALIAIVGTLAINYYNSTVKFDKEKEKANVTESGEAQVINVTEKLYVSWINEIYATPESYLGKTIKLEGMFTAEEYNGKTYYYVYRTGPGCCGNDGSMCGFEFTTNGELPKENDWIEIMGELEQYSEGENKYLSLKDSQITVKTERGLEVVGN